MANLHTQIVLAVKSNAKSNVALGSKADINHGISYVRFWAESGRADQLGECPPIAKADSR